MNAAAQAFVFVEKDHEYYLNGRRLPGISEVLRSVGIGDLDESDPKIAYAAERGRAVHEATALFDQHDLDEGALDPVIVPYLEAWKRFRRETGFRPEPGMIERPLAHGDLGYAGTPDRGGWLGADRIVLEIKATSELPPRVALQLAAQQLLFWHENRFGAIRRFAVQLRDDGTYRLEEYRDHGDRDVFLAALRVWQWKEKHES